MNLDRIEKLVRAELKALYFAKHPTPGIVNDIEGYEARVKRLRIFNGRLTNHRRIMNARAQLAARIEGCRDRLRMIKAMMDQGACIMALDCERHKDNRVLQEVGLSWYQNGKIKTRNFRILDTPRRYNKFAFGSTIDISLAALRLRLAEETARANHYVGHSIAVDFELLRENGIKIPFNDFTDTMVMSWVVPEYHDASLVDLAAYFGVKADQPHNAGNDSRYALEVLLAMIKAYA